MPWSEYYKREYGILKWEAPARDVLLVNDMLGCDAAVADVDEWGPRVSLLVFDSLTGEQKLAYLLRIDTAADEVWLNGNKYTRAPEPSQPMVLDLSMSYLSAEQKQYLLEDLKRSIGVTYRVADNQEPAEKVDDTDDQENGGGA